MQDAYIGDIGDYGKYGLLRSVNETELRLAVNWCKVVPVRPGKQEDGKFTNYLLKPEIYRHFDPVLFDELKQIVHTEQNRTIARIEASPLLTAHFHSDPIDSNRAEWHQRALQNTAPTDIVFLDPDNGLETYHMYQSDNGTEKHVKWDELADYYRRGQSVILYQHRPQMTPKANCVQQLLQFNFGYLFADAVYILEFPKYTNRFYCFFTHREHIPAVTEIYNHMRQHWQGLCNGVDLDY